MASWVDFGKVEGGDAGGSESENESRSKLASPPFLPPIVHPLDLIAMSTSQSRKLGSSTYTPPDPPSFLSFLYSPLDFATQVVTSKRTHLNLLRLALLSLLGIASLIISAGGYGVLWFSWGKVSGWEGNMQLHYG